MSWNWAERIYKLNLPSQKNVGPKVFWFFATLMIPTNPSDFCYLQGGQQKKQQLPAGMPAFFLQPKGQKLNSRAWITFGSQFTQLKGRFKDLWAKNDLWDFSTLVELLEIAIIYITPIEIRMIASMGKHHKLWSPSKCDAATSFPE